MTFNLNGSMLASSLKAIDFGMLSEHAQYAKEYLIPIQTRIEPSMQRLDDFVQEYGYTNLGLLIASVPLSIILITVLLQVGSQFLIIRFS